MIIEENFNLKQYNTLNIEMYSRYFTKIESFDDLIQTSQFIKDKNIKFQVLGGGSNILFTNNFDGIILYNNIDNIENIKILEITNSNIFIKVPSGMNWSEFVNYCVKHSYFGLENLSGIPGQVGSSVIQNIGAYGAEVKDYISSVEFYKLSDSKVYTFDALDCHFGYRDSIFKKKLKNDIFILSVTFKLNRKFEINQNYSNFLGGISDELKLLDVDINKVTNIRAEDISKAVLNLRQRKLLDPQVYPNAGSFFKNVIVDKDQLELILAKYNDIKLKFPELTDISKEAKLIESGVDVGKYKLPTSWLIQSCGFRGDRIEEYYPNMFGGASVSPKHALVLYNKNNALGKDIFDLSEKIIEAVYNQYNILLEREVVVI